MLKTNFVFNISAVSSTFPPKNARNCRNVKSVNSRFSMLKNVLETAEMLKMLKMLNVFEPLGLKNKILTKKKVYISAVSSTFSKKNTRNCRNVKKEKVFNISAVSSTFPRKNARNCRNVKSVNSRISMLKNVLETAEMLKMLIMLIMFSEPLAHKDPNGLKNI